MFTLLRRIAAGRRPYTPAQPTEEELRAQRIAGYERDLWSLGYDLRQFPVKVAASAVMLLLAAAHLVLGILLGVDADWYLASVSHSRRYGGPLWAVLILCWGIALLLGWAGVATLLRAVRTRRLDLLRRERLLLQHELDLASTRTP